MKTILTGLRVNSEFTLGNFLGALLPMVRLANHYNADSHINIFVPDLHSIISDIDGELQSNIIHSLKYYLAAGLDVTSPSAQLHVHVYRQSYVPAHTQLAWALNCIATMGELQRMTQYKDKSAGKDSVNVGIFDYPVLMAADILLYDATYIPVGEDQFQHLELTRNLALRFNHRFSPIPDAANANLANTTTATNSSDTSTVTNPSIFTLPATPADQAKFMGLSDGNGIRIRDLQTPTKKMSKSTQSANSKIMLTDAPAQAAKKIMSATTDSVGKIQYDMFNQPGISNLLQIEALVTNTPLQDVISTWAGETRYGDLKQKVASSVSTFLEDIQTKLAQIPDSQIINLLATGETYANQIANQKLEQVYHVLHLR